MTSPMMRVIGVVAVVMALTVPGAAGVETEDLKVPLPSTLYCDGTKYNPANPNHHVVPSLDGLQAFNSAGEAVLDLSGATTAQVVFGVWDSGTFPSYSVWKGNRIIGSGFNDRICAGLMSADYVAGGAGDDRIFGGSAPLPGGNGWEPTDDTITGGPGSDVLYAGISPHDSYPYEAAFAESAGCDGPDLWGNGGDDLLMGDGCTNQLRGGGGDDTIYGDGLADQMWGDGGADEMYGGGGDDFAAGGPGPDMIDGGDGSDDLEGNGGADRIVGGLTSEFTDPLHELPRVPYPTCGTQRDTGDTIRGGSGPDVISGGDGDDDIAGDQGADGLFGECGADRVAGGSGGDLVSGGPHADRVFGNSGNDLVFGEAGSDRAAGGSGDDAVAGGSEDDLIMGQRGADEISGGEGNDALFDDTPASPGDGDQDHMAGGLGDDTYTSACTDQNDSAHEEADEGANDRAYQFYQDALTPSDDNFEVIFACAD
jgi:Ca2+-binding RTX toxin-like protein